MSQWYYEKDGQQQGPVSLEQLQRAASNGEIASTSLVWNETLPTWTAAGQIADLTSSFSAPAPSSYPSTATAVSSNPYAAPQSNWMAPVAAPTNPGEALPEIIPGSEPLDAPACIKRGWDLMVRNGGIVALVMLVYVGCTWGASLLVQLISLPLGMMSTPQDYSSYNQHAAQAEPSYIVLGITFGLGIMNNIFNLFINLGMLRIWLNLASGKKASVGMIFGQGRKLLTAIGATIIYGIAVGIGLILLIVPGIYIALRYGQYMNAIVDKNLGVMDSLQYSSNLTTGNRMPLFVFWVLYILVMIAGFLAFCVGLLAAIPIMGLAVAVAYRWLQYGQRVVLDHPGTQIPQLSAN